MGIVNQVLKQTLTITTFVFVMMLWVDYINVLTRGKLSRFLNPLSNRQYVVSSLLGATPGCLGAFMNVSFYMHGLLSFGALVSGMIATSGDEAFVMIALFPGKTLLLAGILFVLGIASGKLVDRMGGRLGFLPGPRCLLTVLHEAGECGCFDPREALRAWKKISAMRLILVLLVGASLISILTGVVGSQSWDWKRVTFLVLAASALFIVTTVPEHYLTEHVWRHVIVRHVWKVAAWTFLALLLVTAVLSRVAVEDFVRSHAAWMLLLACLVGVIPESGPHLLFVFLFAEGAIPFSVLVAGSVVQDGHGMLPLLSHSVRDAALVKAVNLVVGLLAGGALHLLGM
jgi:hypothetical protein